MKYLNITLTHCTECPYCSYKYQATAYLCTKSQEWLATTEAENHKVKTSIPAWCELDDIEEEI